MYARIDYQVGFDYGNDAWELVTDDTSYTEMELSKQHDVSSLKVREGCTLYLYRHTELGGWIGGYVKNVRQLPEEVDNTASSYSCHCYGK